MLEGKTLNIVNLTPHALNLMPAGPTGPVVTIPPSGQVARCAVDRQDVFIVDDAVRDDQGRIIGARALAHV